MMPHPWRTLAITAGLGVAALIPAVLWPTPATSAVLAYAMPAAAAGGALATAVVVLLWAAPHVIHAVRTLRAWQADRRASAAHVADAPHRSDGAAGNEPAEMRTLARLVVFVIVAAVAGVAVCAVALNYAHGRDVAEWNGEPGWRAWLYPLPADGLLIAASLVLVWQLLEDGRTSWRPRVAFGSGIGFSAGTNVLAALHSDVSGWALVERIGWTVGPTGVLLLAHEMLLLILAHYARRADLFGNRGPNPAVLAAQQAQQDAEARAAAAETRAVEQAREAQEAAQALLNQEREAAERKLTERAAETARLQAELTNTHEQHQAELHRLRVDHDTAQEAAEQARTELDELAHATGDDDSRDFESVAAAAGLWVEQLRKTRPQESLVAEVSAVFSVSPRWVQKRLPQATQQRPDHHADSRVSQLAFAG